jgi:cell division protein FtsL
MASRSASVHDAVMPEPWWSASPFAGTAPVFPSRSVPIRPPGTRPLKPAPTPVWRQRPRTRPHDRARVIRRSAHSLAFPVLASVLFLLCVVVAPLGFNVLSLRTNWEIAKVEQQQKAQEAQRASLKAEVARLASPDRVKQAAEKMGMVPVKPGYLRLNDRDLLAQAQKPQGASSP